MVHSVKIPLLLEADIAFLSHPTARHRPGAMFRDEDILPSSLFITVQLFLKFINLPLKQSVPEETWD